MVENAMGIDRPDAAAARTPAEFVAALRLLKRWSGMGYRRLAAKANAAGDALPRSTLTDALNRDSLPREDLVTSFTRTCGCDKDEVERWVAARRRVAATPDTLAAPTARVVIPAQLPMRVPEFVGRAVELAQLGCLTGRDGPQPTPMGIVMLSGSAGVGKTALALHWGHQAAPRFPDGQLYANLRGFDPSGTPLTPAEAVRGFLDAFAVPANEIPAGLDAQAGLYRSLLAGRRVLVLLDNARDAIQVRPLLPGSDTCLTVVTSRARLTGLVAAEGAHPIILDLFHHAEARELLARRIGEARVTAEPDAVDAIIVGCARLPLAVAVAAGRAIAQPALPLSHLAHQLHESEHSLDALAGDDPDTNVRAVFSWSYRHLSPACARMFRLLGSAPGPDIGIRAAASIAGLPAAHVRPLIDELVRAHLIIEAVPDRYTLHDLLRAYATELANGDDSDDEQHAAIHRLLDHYQHTANAAASRLVPHRDPIPLAEHRPGVTPERFDDQPQAHTWLSAEHRVLVAAIATAAATGHDAHAWQIAWSLMNFLDRQGHWHDWAHTQRLALAASQRRMDRRAQALAHRSLGWAYTKLGRYEDALAHYQHALRLSAALGDHLNQAHTTMGLAHAADKQGRHLEALDHAQDAFDLFQKAGHQTGQARALNTIGWHQAQLGNHTRALSICREALALHQAAGNRAGEAFTWDSIGYAHHHLGQHQQAIASYHNALDLWREQTNRFNESDTMDHLGDTHHAAGNPDTARIVWRHALTIRDQLNHPDTATIRAKLRAAD